MPQDIRELLIGVVAISSIGLNADSYTPSHSILGLLLLLFLGRDWSRTSSIYDQIIFSVVAGCCVVLTAGYFLDANLEDARRANIREEVQAAIWLVSAFTIGIFRRPFLK